MIPPLVGSDYPGVTVSFLCHDGKGKYLLMKRSIHCRDEHNTWSPGCGTLEFSETIEGALRRELKEEFCIEKFSYEFLGYRDVFRSLPDGAKSHWVGLDFLVEVDPKEVQNGEPDKADELTWFDLDNLPTPQHSQLQAFLENLKQYHARQA